VIVNIENVGYGISGWTSYVLGENNERKNAKLIFGDTLLGDKICNMIDYKSGNYTRLVISFSSEDNVNPEKGRELVKEFIEHFMYGFRKDEYHVDCVEHADTEHLHYHLRIPKLNLLTQTQLKPYWHRSDLDRKKAIIDFMAVKHDLVIGTDMLKIIKNPVAVQEKINKWRETSGQDAFDFSKKGSRSKSEEEIIQYIKGKSIDSFYDLKSILTDDMGLDIVKIDRDKNKGFSYITVENETGKVRLKGDIFSKQFYEKGAITRSVKLNTNVSLDASNKLDSKIKEVTKNLKIENKKRLRFIAMHYKVGRKRAYDNKRNLLKKKLTVNKNNQIQDEGLKHDRDRKEITRRIRNLRRRRRERERILRSNRIKYNEQFSRTDENLNRNSKQVTRIFEDARKSTVRNNKAIEQAIEARQINRTAERQLKSIFRYFGNKFNRFKQRIDRANRELFETIVSKVKNLRASNSSSKLERENKKWEELIDNLMPENYFYVNPEEKVSNQDTVKPKPRKSKPQTSGKARGMKM
jgi:hypothetical protein